MHFFFSRGIKGMFWRPEFAMIYVCRRLSGKSGKMGHKHAKIPRLLFFVKTACSRWVCAIDILRHML